MTCDKVAAQDPRSPPWTLSDVPTKYRARVEAMPPVPTAKVVAFITQAASRFGCLPSRSLRAPVADRQRNLLRWAVAVALCPYRAVILASTGAPAGLPLSWHAVAGSFVAVLALMLYI
jgi:hypothetical protein